MGDNFDETKLAAGASLEDYNELYKTTFFSIIMYLVGSASILYLMFKPKLQSVWINGHLDYYGWIDKMVITYLLIVIIFSLFYLII